MESRNSNWSFSLHRTYSSTANGKSSSFTLLGDGLRQDELWSGSAQQRGQESTYLSLKASCSANSRLGIWHCALQAQGQLQLASQIMPMIATIPSAAERTACLAHVWGAIVELDLATRRAERAGDKAGPANELRRTLTEPFLLGVISASEIGAPLMMWRICGRVSRVLVPGNRHHDVFMLEKKERFFSCSLDIITIKYHIVYIVTLISSGLALCLYSQTTTGWLSQLILVKSEGSLSLSVAQMTAVRVTLLCGRKWCALWWKPC